MEINYTIDAFKALNSLVIFIEENNTSGAGIRWLKKFEKFLKNEFKRHHFIQLCNNKSFKLLLLKCIYYNEWLIAFSVSESEITIEALLHRSRILD